ncbi:MOSC domain-containing protein [Ornithinimicrobium faecis]|uniref:MOSC domain-containing protein n=1 Tax=Ornithinimicrobium faecis TaxID=2934158 RepID=A0ABY4YWI0_9MICO|nr:MOSC domain-containing protein [Ornithinimicrobium sp. HY1793]USQ81113.1 MOSC domain-containing protein [Ornithinimicrobium sp. HY1793]
MPTAPRVLSLNIGKAVATDHTSAPGGITGIDKYAVSSLSVRAPGPKVGGLGSGVVGDHIGDQRFHGGDNKAVYLFAREELDWWEIESGRSLRSGIFGENVTTVDFAVDDLVVGSSLAVGDPASPGVVLRVAGPRIPCRTFAGHLGERQWIKRFTARGLTGAYCAVEVPGQIHTDDAITVTSVPDHGITVPQLFRALTGDLELVEQVIASEVLAGEELAQLAESFERRTGRRPA